MTDLFRFELISLVTISCLSSSDDAACLQSGQDSFIENIKKSSVSRRVAETKLHRDNRHEIERDLSDRLSAFNGGHGANDKWSVNIAAQNRDEYSNHILLRRLGAFSSSHSLQSLHYFDCYSFWDKFSRSPHLLDLHINTCSFGIGKIVKLYAHGHSLIIHCSLSINIIIMIFFLMFRKKLIFFIFNVSHVNLFVFNINCIS